MRKKSIIISILSVIAFSSLAFGGVMVRAEHNPYKTTDSLVKTKFVTVEMQADAISDSIVDTRTGLLLRPERQSATVMFAKAFSGEFSLEYRLLKNASDAYGLKNFSILFQAKDRNESFSINVKNEKQGRLYTVCAGESAFTLSGSEVSYKVTGEEVDTVCFDPNTMIVSVNNEKLWSFNNFKNENFDSGVLFDGFSMYEVSILFEDAKADGGLLAYELNGQILGDTILKDTAEPGIYAPVKYNGVVGDAYSLPKPYVYDVVDDEVESAMVYYTLRYNNVIVSQGIYEDGYEFTPMASGEYELTYTVQDSVGNEKALKQVFSVLEEKPSVSFLNYGELRDCVIGKGGSISIPRMRAETELSHLRDPFVYVNIYKDDVLTVDGVDLFAEGFEYTFKEEGEYLVTYSLYDTYKTVGREYRITVTEDTPYLTLEVDLPEYVIPNTRYILPNATFTLGDTTVTAEKAIVYPSGAKYKGTYVTLSDYGYYELIYTVKIGDVEYAQSRWLKCINPSESLFTGNVELEVTEYTRNGESYKGVAVTETIGQEGVKFNMPIDLTGKTKDDVLIDLTAYPLTAGETDFGELYVKFTDIYNEDNYFTVKFWQCPISWGNGDVTYIKAAHSGQNYVGVGPNGRVYSEPADPYWGTWHPHAFAGDESMALSNRTIRISMDYETKRIYCAGTTASMDDGAITDLTDLSLYTKAWEGFTDGKCYVSIESKGIKQTHARYIINKIGDIDLSEDFVEYGKPTIKIDFEENEDIPVGIVGQKYPLFRAVATDLFGNSLKVEKRVYAFFGTAKEFEIDVVENEFIPPFASDFTVIYSATNGLNVRSEEIWTVRVEAESEKLAVHIENDAVLYSKTGILVPIANVTFTGNHGYVTINSISVTGKSSNAVCEVNDGAFLAKKADTYIVKYTVSDHLGRTAENSYEVELVANDEIIFGDLNLLPIYTVGQGYILPAVKGNDFSSGDCTEAEVTISVQYADNYVVTLGGDRMFTPEGNHGDVCTVIYSAKPIASNDVNILSQDVALLSYSTTLGNIQIGDYFLKENVTFIKNELFHRVQVEEGKSEAAFTFAKPLMAKKLALMFEIEKEYNAFNRLKITLTDSQDTSLQVELNVVKNSNKSDLYINNSSKVYAIEGSFWGKEDEINGNTYDFLIKYNNSTYQLVDASGKVVAGIVSYKNGKAFQGFPSNKVYVRFDFEELTGDGKVAINLLQFNNQFLGEVYADTIKPELFVDGDYGGVTTLGDTLILPTAYAEDVLGFIKNVGVTVIAPSGSIVTAEDGTLLDGASVLEHGYSFKVGEEGKYIIQYCAIDTNSNKATTLERIVYSIKTDKPSANLTGTVPTTGKVGQEISIPDIDEGAKSKYDYTVYILDPYFTQWLLYNTAGQEKGALVFTPKLQGEYILRYYIYDEYYNYIMYDYVILVS